MKIEAMSGAAGRCVAAAAGAALALVAGASTANAEGAYVRLGLMGFDWGQPTVFQDRDCTRNTVEPLALFGCEPGNDALPIGAYGTFGFSPTMEIAFGMHIAPHIRLEAALSARPGLQFFGDANFTGTPDPQPVTATLMQSSLMGWAYADLAPGAVLQPFIGVGAGVSLNVLSPMYYDFPGLTQPAWSETPGGTRLSFAYGFAVGIAHEVNEGVTLELAFRHVNYGRAATDVGVMSSQRGGPPFDIVIDETWTRLVTNAVMFSVRWEIGGRGNPRIHAN